RTRNNGKHVGCGNKERHAHEVGRAQQDATIEIELRHAPLEYLLAAPFVRHYGVVGCEELVECHVVVDGRVVAAHKAGELMLEEFLLVKACSDQIGKIAERDIDQAVGHRCLQLDRRHGET